MEEATEVPHTGSDLDPGLGVEDILHNLHFIFIAHGVILLVIVVLGIVLNSLCLGVLCRQCFRASPPYCLLQALTLGDLAVLFFSVYSDVQPAIEAHHAVQGLVLPDDTLLQRLDSLLEQSHHHHEDLAYNDSAVNRSRDLATDQELELFLKSLLGPDVKFQLTRLPEVTLVAKEKVGRDPEVTTLTNQNIGCNPKVTPLVNESVSCDPKVPEVTTLTNDNVGCNPKVTILANENVGCNLKVTTLANESVSCSSRQVSVGNYRHTTEPDASTRPGDLDRHGEHDRPSHIEINTEPLRKAVERFIAYFLMTYNLLVVVVLAVERCFVVLRPIKAKVVITAKRTRWAVFVITFACLVIHSPQLVKEVVFVLTEPALLRDDFQGTLLQSFRRHYETFVVYLTSLLLVTAVTLNVVLLVAVVRQQRKMRRALPRSAPPSEKTHNLNIAYVIMCLTLVQLPQTLAANVIAHLAMTSFQRHVTSLLKAVVVVRVLYVSNSALNCLVYCLIAQRFRRAFLRTYWRRCRKGKEKGRGKGSGQRKEGTSGSASSLHISARSRTTTLDKAPSPSNSVMVL